MDKFEDEKNILIVFNCLLKQNPMDILMFKVISLLVGEVFILLN